jgi:outer membrane usher protein
VRLHRHAELSASLTRSNDERGRSNEFYAAVTALFGRSSATVAHTRDARGSRLSVDAQQPLPAGSGYGFQMRAETGDADLVTGAAQYQGAHGRYELRQEAIGDSTRTTISAMGALVAIGGGLHATRPVNDSFALIRVPGVAGVRGLASNQEIGRTGRNGDLLVPDLRPYYANTLDIVDGDVPLEYAVPDVRLILAPPYRGGAVALFPVHRVQRIVGKVRQRPDGADRTTSFGELTVSIGEQTFASPVGVDGSFYFENLPAGRHRAVVQDPDGRCTVELEIPTTDALVVKLGTVSCQSDQ